LLFAFFFDPSALSHRSLPHHPKTSPHPATSHHPATFNWLCGFDELNNRLELPAGLGDLPLYAQKDGWYSVLGPRKGTTDNPEGANEGGQTANPEIPPAPVNPPRNARPDPVLNYCEYPKCSGNRLAIPLHTQPYSHRALY